jgi:hypothetical protein
MMGQPIQIFQLKVLFGFDPNIFYVIISSVNLLVERMLQVWLQLIAYAPVIWIKILLTH